MGGPADALGLGEQPIAHHVDEIGNMDVDGAVSALGIVGCLCSDGTLRPVTLAGLSPVRWS